MPKASNINVREILSKVGPYDVIQVFWLDASVTTNTKGKINNKVIATYKWSIGQFYDIITDKTYGIEHLVLISVDSHPDNPIVISIPLGSVANVKPVDLDHDRIKSVNRLGIPFLTGRYVKIIERGEGIGNT